MPYLTDCNSGPSEFPESIVTVTLEFGPYLRADGSPVAQPISITPSVEVLDIDSGAVIMALRPVTLRASQTRVILPATDSPGLSPIDFTYQVTIGGVPKVVSLPMAHPVVDFDLLVSSEPSPGTIIWHPPTLPSGGEDGDVLAWADAEDGGTRWMSPGEWPGVQRAEEAAQQAGEAAQQAEDARDGMVVGGTVDGDDLLLSTVGGDTIVAGNVRGQKGDPGTASPEFLAGVQAAQDAQAGAEEARDEAEQSASQADASKTGAETAQGLAVTARTGAETARTGAEQARDEAETAQGLAEAARTGAETAQGLAVTARTGAETAQGLAVTARTGAETAQGLAEDARDAAQAANAATVTSGTVTGDDLILTRTDATTVNAGNVRGNAGPPNELAIGTVTTGAPGSAAAASISGTAPSQTLNLTIPRGDAGASAAAVATWTQTGNRLATVTAVDIATSTFTAAGHGLVNGDYVCPFTNPGITAGIQQYLPGGMGAGRYRVSDVTATTFRLAELTLSVRATMDLTKWHFETTDTAFAGLTGLTGTRFRLITKGQASGVSANTHWTRFGANISGTTFLTSNNFLNGSGAGNPSWLLAVCDLTFDTRAIASIMGYWSSIGQKTTDADNAVITRTVAENQILATPLAGTNIASIGVFVAVGAAYWANGSTMEVYAL